MPSSGRPVRTEIRNIDFLGPNVPIDRNGICSPVQSHDIFESSKRSSKPKLVGLFCHVAVKRYLRALALLRAFGNVTAGGIGCGYEK